jgi:hypothetical protein
VRLLVVFIKVCIYLKRIAKEILKEQIGRNESGESLPLFSTERIKSL